MWPLLLLGGLYIAGRITPADWGVFGIDKLAGQNVFTWDDEVPSVYSVVRYGNGFRDPATGEPAAMPTTAGQWLADLGIPNPLPKTPPLPGEQDYSGLYLAGGLALGAVLLTRKGKR